MEDEPKLHMLWIAARRKTQCLVKVSKAMTVSIFATSDGMAAEGEMAAPPTPASPAAQDRDPDDDEEEAEAEGEEGDEGDAEGEDEVAKQSASVEDARRHKSEALRQHPAVVSACDDLWEIRNLQAALDSEGLLGMEDYVNLLIKFQYLVLPPPVKFAQARRNAEIDWENDMAKVPRHEGQRSVRMSKAVFREAVFEIADTWSVEADANEYVMILKTLLVGVTVLAKQGKGGKAEAAHHGVAGEARVLIESNKSIQHNPLFEQQAAVKFDGFSKLFTQRKKVKARLSPDKALSSVGKLYQSKLEADDKARLKKQPVGRFDRFVMDSFTMQYGSRRLARKHLRRLFAAVRELVLAGDPVMTMFAVLIGLGGPPTRFNVLVLEYDPFLASDYFLPTLVRVLDDVRADATCLPACLPAVLERAG